MNSTALIVVSFVARDVRTSEFKASHSNCKSDLTEMWLCGKDISIITNLNNWEATSVVENNKKLGNIQFLKF